MKLVYLESKVCAGDETFVRNGKTNLLLESVGVLCCISRLFLAATGIRNL